MERKGHGTFVGGLNLRSCLELFAQKDMIMGSISPRSS